MTYEETLRGIMTKEVLAEMAKDKKHFEEALELLSNAAKEQGLTGIPGSDWMSIQQKMNETILIRSEVAAAFSDDDIKILTEDQYKHWFREYSGQPVIPVFEAIQTLFTSCVKNNHVKSLKYLLENTPMEEYDIDGLDMLIAIKDQKPDVINLLIEHLDRESYGFQGVPGIAERVHAEAKRHLSEATWMDQEMRTKLLEFEMFKD